MTCMHFDIIGFCYSFDQVCEPMYKLGLEMAGQDRQMLRLQNIQYIWGLNFMNITNYAVKSFPGEFFFNFLIFYSLLHSKSFICSAVSHKS